ncbi:hypothetical protein ABPG77_003298 [Micractinium sp. CCAP 211/92]
MHWPGLAALLMCLPFLAAASHAQHGSGGPSSAGGAMASGRRLLADPLLPLPYMLVPGQISCAAECAKRGQVQVGVFPAAGKSLCAYSWQDKQFYWGTEQNGFCRFRNLAQGNHTTERRDYYTCACRDPATKLHWAPDLLCASGPSAAAQDPAVCRVRKLGGGDWQAGTWVNSTCYISDEPFGKDGAPVGAVYNVGGPHKVQLLCAGPASRRRLAAATDAGGSAGRRALSGGRRLAELHPAKTFDTYFSKPDCPFTCKRAGLRPVTGGSANASRVLCSKTNYLGSMRFYGTWNSSSQACSYLLFENQFSFGEYSQAYWAYECVCQLQQAPWAWQPSTVCLQPEARLIPHRQPCRVTRASGEVAFGFINGYDPQDVCDFYPTPIGPGGKTVHTVVRVGGPDKNGLTMDILCRMKDRRKCSSVKATRAGLAQKARDLAAAQNAIRYTTNETLRWAGIVNKTCPPSLPSHADATSFIVWLYWTAFGQGKDHLTNQEDWQGGGPAIMGLTGRQVSETKGVQLASYAHAQPGDIVFYGTFSKAWPALYVGNGEVVGLRNTQFGGRLQVKPIYHRQDVLQIRSYPDFRWAAPPGQGPS